MKKEQKDQFGSVLFTVVIIAYNVEKYIRQCIQSVIEQNTKIKYEILIVDDGSTDNTSSIIDEYPSKFEMIKVIHKNNEGSGYARNEGIKRANGEWIIFLDGDDYLDDGTIESFLKYTSTDIDVCLGRIKYFVDGSLDEPKAEKKLIDEEALYSCANGKECFSLIRKVHGSVCLGTKGIYRTSFIRFNKLYQKDYKRGQDNDWAVRVFRCAGKMSYNSYPYYCYRKNRVGSAVNVSSLEKAIDVLTMQKEWISISHEENNEFGCALEAESLKRFWSYFKQYSTSLEKDKVTDYCDAINASRYIYSTARIKKSWMTLLDLFGAKPIAVIIRACKIVIIENIIRNIKIKIEKAIK